MTMLVNPYAHGGSGGGGGSLSVAGRSTSTSSGTTTHTVTLPSSPTSGQLIVIFIGSGDSEAFTPPAGFKSVRKLGAARGHVFWKISDGTEGTSVDVTTSSSADCAHAAYLIDNADGTLPIASGSGAYGSLNAPWVRSPWGEVTDGLWMSFVNSLDGGSSCDGAPTNYTNLQAAKSGTGSSDCSIGVAERSSYTATEDDPDSWSFDGGTSFPMEIGVVIRPEHSAGSPVVDRNGGAPKGHSSDSSSYDLVLPTNISAGDLIVVAAGCDSTDTISFPAGWDTIVNTSGNSRLHVAATEADGTESGTEITVTLSGSEPLAYFVWVVTGWNDNGTGSAVTDAVEGAVASSNTGYDPPSLSPSWGSANCLWLAIASTDGDTRRATGYPTNYSNGWTVHTDDQSGHISMSVAERELTASSEDPGAFTTEASGTSEMATIAIDLS